MLISNYITPVMLTDYSGFTPSVIESISNWFQNKWNNLTKWMNTVPERDMKSSEWNGVLKAIGNFNLGVGLGLGEGFFNVAGKTTWYIGGNPMAGLATSLKVFGGVVTGLVTTHNVLDLWLSNNGFTNAQRLSLITVEIAGSIATTLAVSLLSSTIVTAGAILSMPVVLAAVGVIVISATVYFGTNWIYEQCEERR